MKYKATIMKENSPVRHAVPLARRHMPRDYTISLDRYIGRDGIGAGYLPAERRIPADFGPRQDMRGFEECYRNIIDYIVRITHKIWEDRDVEYIGETYSRDSLVFDDYGLQRGCQKIIADTHQTTGAFSNIKLIADEIIWAGNDEVGFHTSHRTIIRATNDGDSKYGPATGKDVDVLVIANCVAKGNQIFLEHVLYNNSSLLRQLGFNLEEMVAELAASHPAGWPRSAQTWSDLRSSASPQQPLYQTSPIGGFDVDAFVRNNMDMLWNQRNDEALLHSYHANFSFQGPTNRQFTGAHGYREFLALFRESFPDLELQVDEVYWMGNEADGYLTSERWSATATHLGAGAYAAPTGCKVEIWGITQHRISNGLITGEWMLFNELDLMMQLAAARQAEEKQ